MGDVNHRAPLGAYCWDRQRLVPDALDNRGDAHAVADTHRAQAIAGVLLLHLMQQRRDQARRWRQANARARSRRCNVLDARLHAEGDPKAQGHHQPHAVGRARAYYPGFAGQVPDTIRGYPYVVNNDMAQMGVSAKSILFGDFSNYFIRDALDVQLIRLDERCADTLEVGFIAFMRSDGNLINAG